MENNTENQGIVLVSEIYPDNLAVFPLENRPVLPGLALPLTFFNPKAVQYVEHALEKNNGFIGVSFIRNKNSADYINSELYHTGTLLKIIKVIQKTDDQVHFFAQALTRIHSRKEFVRDNIKFWQVEYDYEPKDVLTPELKAYTLAIINSVKELIKLNPMFQEQMKLALSQIGMEKPGLLMDLVASFLTSDAEKQQSILEAVNLHDRSERLLILLREEIELNLLQQDIQKQIEEKISKQQREFFLREQLKVIKHELGLEKDDKASELETLEKKIER